MTVSLVLAGTLDFDPRTQSLTGANGEDFMLECPYGDELPNQGKNDLEFAAKIVLQTLQ